MKVRCIKLKSEFDKEGSASGWIDLGQLCDVLEIYNSPRQAMFLRIEADDDRTPGLFEASQFEVVDGTVPDGWGFDISPSEGFTLAPKQWLRPGFWEDYFDDVPEAVEEYESVVAPLREARR
jgi:hypothetical protein